MTKKNYRKLIAGHLQWSLVGLIIALFVAFVTSDHRAVVYGSPLTPKRGNTLPAVESAASEVLAPLAPPAPAAPPQISPEAVVPDTINGELVWPDPWDQIEGNKGPVY